EMGQSGARLSKRDDRLGLSRQCVAVTFCDNARINALDSVCESDARRVCAGRLQADVERPAVIEDVLRTTASRQAARATTGIDRILIEHAIPHLLQGASQSRAQSLGVARHNACYVMVKTGASHCARVLCVHNDLLCLAMS